MYGIDVAILADPTPGPGGKRRSDKEIAAAAGMSPEALSNAKKRPDVMSADAAGRLALELKVPTWFLAEEVIRSDLLRFVRWMEERRAAKTAKKSGKKGATA